MSVGQAHNQQGVLSAGKWNSPLNNMHSTFNLSVTKANGGWVVSCSQFNPAEDMIRRENIYVISETEDLGDQLGKIIFQEELKR